MFNYFMVTGFLLAGSVLVYNGVDAGHAYTAAAGVIMVMLENNNE